MNTSISTRDLTTYLAAQLNAFFPDRQVTGAELRDVVAHAMERLEYSFSRIGQKNYQVDGRTTFNHLNTDHYAQFLYFAANSLVRDGGERAVADKLFGLNKALNGIDLNYEVELPSVFILQHPVGTVLGRADYEDYLFVSQNVTVGGNLDLVYPSFGKGVALYSGSKVVGDTKVGNNCWLAVGTIVRDQQIPPNTVTFGVSPFTESKSTDNSVVRDLFKMADADEI